MSQLLPYIPSYITVHLGPPAVPAENVTVSFPDYVKNVASSEVYPTWGEAALRANILAITSFALNRIYTEFYRVRGYPFDITASTAYDQQFYKGRSYFSTISRLVDELFDDYIRRIGFIEPLAAKFCNGTTVTCEGLSQWGSQTLAAQGYGWLQILRRYYGQNIEIVPNAPQAEAQESYPGTALRPGSRGRSVALVQTALNRISQSFPAIPKLSVDGIFGPATEAAVRTFQRVFGLDSDGVVGRQTWYEVERVYAGVLHLSELRSQGLRYEDLGWEFPEPLRPGDRGDRVRQLQYMLAVVAQFVQEVPSVSVDGIFGPRTRDAVAAFQGYEGFAATGEADDRTWDALYDLYSGIDDRVLQNRAAFPQLDTAATTVANARARLEALGYSGTNLQQALRAFQQANGLPVNGRLTDDTAQAVTKQFRSLNYSNSTRMTQYPGTPLSVGSRDARP
ncbi:MAG: peptidoglycan-binding protein [Oscillospiraceae bacterium]|nr:peptidoglycan-binding protein [Oscillospiraceae bacterium]